MTTGAFNDCLAETLKWEGGYSNDAHDPGGMTMKGIIQTEYNAFRRRKGLPEQWVKLISDDEVREIYRASYWDEVNGDLLPAGLDLEVFDGGVNSGPPRAVCWLQKALRVSVDGHMGQETMAAIDGTNDLAGLIERYQETRREFLEALRTFQYFGHGWMDRCQGVQKTALGMAGQDHSHVAHVAPHDDADTQAAGQGRAYPGKSILRTIQDSPSLKILLHTAGVVAAVVTGVFHQAGQAIGNLVGAAPDIQSGVDQVMGPAKGIAESAGIPWDAKLGLCLVLVMTLTIFFRQLPNKRVE